MSRRNTTETHPGTQAPQRRLRFAIILFACSSLSGCRLLNLLETPMQFPAAYEPDVSPMEQILAENPIRPEEDVKITDLTETKTYSTHVMQCNADIKPQFHKKHDLVLYVVKGEGIVILADTRYRVGPGAAITIPRGTVYSLIKVGTDPFVAYATFSPPFDGYDRTYVKLYE